jgi:hypothetical protein
MKLTQAFAITDECSDAEVWNMTRRYPNARNHCF